MKFMGLGEILKVISTDDDKNTVVGMIRVGWLLGLSVYLFAGISMVLVMLRVAWTQKVAGDFQNFGIGMGAWAAGLSAYIAAGAGALWAQAKADAVTPPPGDGK